MYSGKKRRGHGEPVCHCHPQPQHPLGVRPRRGAAPAAQGPSGRGCHLPASPAPAPAPPGGDRAVLPSGHCGAAAGGYGAFRNRSCNTDSARDQPREPGPVRVRLCAQHTAAANLLHQPGPHSELGLLIKAKVSCRVTHRDSRFLLVCFC